LRGQAALIELGGSESHRVCGGLRTAPELPRWTLRLREAAHGGAYATVSPSRGPPINVMEQF
jgi:hypothetical protein